MGKSLLRVKIINHVRYLLFNFFVFTFSRNVKSVLIRYVFFILAESPQKKEDNDGPNGGFHTSSVIDQLPTSE